MFGAMTSEKSVNLVLERQRAGLVYDVGLKATAQLPFLEMCQIFLQPVSNKND